MTTKPNPLGVRTPAKPEPKDVSGRPIKLKGRTLKDAMAFDTFNAEFDGDSYPIWVDPFLFTQDAGLLSDWDHSFFRIKGSVAPTTRIGLILSSKLVIHGIGLFYSGVVTKNYITRIALYIAQHNPEEGNLQGKSYAKAFDSGEIKLFSHEMTEARFIVKPPNGIPVNGPAYLEIGMIFGDNKKPIPIHGIRLMVKDI